MAQDIGERGRKYMKNKIKYSDEPMNNVKVVQDFLPSPEELAFKEETVKVTISLSRSSINFFKEVANSSHVSYQKMIRRLLDEYVLKQKKAS